MSYRVWVLEWAPNHSWAADILHDAASPVEQLVEGQDLGGSHVFPVEFEAGDLIVVPVELRKISDDEKTPGLDRINNAARAVADLVSHVIGKTIPCKLEGSLLYLRHGARHLFRHAPASGAVGVLLYL